MPVAIAPETVSSLALLALSIVVLLGGTLIANRLSRAAPQTIRVAFPLIAIATFSAFALLVFISRLTR
ncbi:MAG: hypothetical protein ACYCO3_04260 [Mycobacteriales bacterium]